MKKRGKAWKQQVAPLIVEWPERIDPRDGSRFLPAMTKRYNGNTKKGRRDYLSNLSDRNAENTAWLECEAILKSEIATP